MQEAFERIQKENEELRLLLQGSRSVALTQKKKKKKIALP